MGNVQMEIPQNVPRSNHTLRDSLVLIFLSLVGWITVFVVSGWISRRLIRKVRAMDTKDQIIWQLSMVRLLSGPGVLWAAYMIFVDKRITVDHVFASTDQSWALVCVSTSFYLFEELTLIYFETKYRKFSKEMHAHHFFVIIGYSLGVYYARANYYTAKLFLLQISTPFSCICWCLLRLRLEQSKAWKINQWILINIFHLRSVYEIYCWYGFYQDWDYMKQNLPWPYIINMLTGLGIITIWLTPFWAYKNTVQYFYPNHLYVDQKVKKHDEFIKTS